MKSVVDIIAALPELNLTDLRAIQVALDKEMLKYLRIDEDLYSMVFEITGEKPLGINKFFGSPLGAQWRKNQPALDALISKLIEKKQPKQVVLRALKKFILEIMVDYIREHSMPLSMRTICNQLGNIQSIFDEAFPGYLSSGLGMIILKQLEGSNGR